MTHSPTRLRIRFTKCGDLRWISHRDLARVWERLLRRAELTLAFSQGFHPKPKISFPSALPLGVEAIDEVVELELLGQVSLTDVQRRISAEAPTGLELVSVELVTGKAKLLGSSYQILLEDDVIEPTRERIKAMMEGGWVRVEREGRVVECPVSDHFFELSLHGNKLTFTLPAVSEGAAIRPSELLEQLGLGNLLSDGASLVRLKVHLADSPELNDSNQNHQNIIHRSDATQVRSVNENNQGQA
jgi:radical SAM-linked protein